MQLAGCVSPPESPPPAPAVIAPPPQAFEPAVLEIVTGLASYYHPSLHGLETASGIPYDDNALMAAHPSYPLGTVVRVKVEVIYWGANERTRLDPSTAVVDES